MSGKAERPSKRLRKLSTDSEDTDGPIDWSTDQRGKKAGPAVTGSGTGPGVGGSRAEQTSSGRKQNETRPRRGTGSEQIAVATVSRGPPSAKSTSPTSMRLTVKTSSTKLREATRSSPVTATVASTISVNSREKLDGQVIEGKRSRNVRKSYVLESESEEDEDEPMDDVVDDDDAEGESIEEDDEDLDAEREEDADGDIDMDIPPPAPIITVSKAKSGKSAIVVKPPPKVDTKTVERKEVEAGSDDEELSELDSDMGEEVEEEEGMQAGDDEDAEGDEEMIEVEEDAEEEEELDSDDETPMDGSRASTPDLTKLTKRQRARLEEGGSGHLLALPDEVQVKKHLTAEEHQMRRVEMARRRKNLSEKRNEEEKMETINKLLKKQAPKTNARRGAFNPVAGESTPDGDQKPNAIFVRWVSNKDGNRIGVPEEWLEGPVGQLFQGGVKQASMGGKLIQEVA